MAFAFVAFSYVFALTIDAVLIFFSIFHIISFEKLKSDYKNPIEHCSCLNSLVLPEYGIHLLANVLFVVTGEWFSLLLNIPLISYNVHRYVSRPVMSGVGIYDPTSILNTDVFNKCYKEGWIKLAFHSFSFFYYLYAMIYSLISFKDKTKLI